MKYHFVRRLQCIKIEDILIPLISNNGYDKCPEARLQIVIVCPLFLQKIQTIPEDEKTLGKVFHADKLVAMMLGVQQHLENERVKTGEYDLYAVDVLIVKFFLALFACLVIFDLPNAPRRLLTSKIRMIQTSRVLVLS